MFSRINPNTVTILALLFCIAAGLYFAAGNLVIAGFMLLLGGFFDVLDGAVARENGRVTKFGGLLDSVLDRYADAAVFLGIMWGGHAALPPYIENDWFLGGLALTGSLLVSYTRARAEAGGTGVLNIGVAERAERMILIILGAFTGLLHWAVLVVAVISHLTVLQRMIAARRILKEQ
ncbi:MAG: CDP-alcohol phosphatidyltransferase family protein [Methanosarcinales archaeon]|nr:CDP-alcohol phosphatidyltransferase family protein [Methanosarcinales archaeon]